MLFKEQGDITLRRSRGNSASVKANPSAEKKQTDNELILVIFKRVFKTTAKDVAAEMNKPLNCISGRFSHLKSKGYIRGTGSFAENNCEWLEITQKGIEA